MLLALFPLYVFDGILDVFAAGFHLWQVPDARVVISMEEPALSGGRGHIIFSEFLKKRI